MPTETWPQIAGVGAIAAGFGTLVWKIFSKQQDLYQQLIQVIKENSKSNSEQAVAQVKLSEAVNGLERNLSANISANTAATTGSKDAINTLLSHVIPRAPMQ